MESTKPLAWVTGGAGYIGSNVVRALLAKDWRVVVFDNFSTGTKRFVPKSVKHFEGDLHVAATSNNSDYLCDLEREGKPNTLIHLAAKTDVSWCEKNPSEAYRENVSNTMEIAELAVKHGCKNMVFASSAAVYGEQVWYTSTSKTDGPTVPIGVYGQTKLDAEKMLNQYMWRHLNVTVLRMFNVAGAGCGEQFNISPRGNPSIDSRALFPSMVRAFLNGGKIQLRGRPAVFGTAYPVRDFIHVSDVAKIFVNTAETLRTYQAKGFVFNVGRSKPVNIKDLLQLTQWSKEQIEERVEWEFASEAEIMHSVAGGENVGDGAKRTLANMWLDEVRWQKSKIYQHIKTDKEKACTQL